jgi:hypothetical protein
MAHHRPALNPEAAARKVRLVTIAVHRLEDPTTGSTTEALADLLWSASQLVEHLGAKTVSDEDLAAVAAIWSGKSRG